MTEKKTNNLNPRELLSALGLIDPENIVKFSDRVRDREDIYSLRCRSTGIIFLSDSKHAGKEYYSQKTLEPGVVKLGSELRVLPALGDTERRCQLIKTLVTGSKWLDFGCGGGALLSELKDKPKIAVGLDPDSSKSRRINTESVDIYGSLQELPPQEFDIVTMFHVFEHLADPLGELRALKKFLRSGSRLVIEVPHARDLMLAYGFSSAYKEFALWSEHLILHTKDSIAAFLQESGFRVSAIKRIQRYPLSNHLFWLLRKQPGGHKRWKNLNCKAIEVFYSRLLAALDMTDTLYVVAIYERD